MGGRAPTQRWAWVHIPSQDLEEMSPILYLQSRGRLRWLRKMTWDAYYIEKCSATAWPWKWTAKGRGGRKKEAVQRRVWKDLKEHESRRRQPLPPALGSETFMACILKGQGQMLSSVQRNRPIKTGHGDEAGAGDTDLGEPASAQKPQWWTPRE